MKHGQLAVAVELTYIGDQLHELDSVQRPTVRIRAGFEFLGSLRECYVQATLSSPHAFPQKVKRERGFSGARIAVDQVQPGWYESAVQNLVQPRDAESFPRQLIR